MATKTSRKSQSTETAKPPVAKLRIGLINATIWERVTDNGKFHSVTFERQHVICPVELASEISA